MSTPAALPLPLWRRGKVRDVYAVGSDRLLLVASDRISAFDVVLDRPIPEKGRVLTQLSAFWFRRLASVTPTHFITADIAEILEAIPELAQYHDRLAGRTTLARRTEPIAFECVVRGYLAGSAWAEYREHGTLAGEPLPTGLSEAGRLVPPRFSPATKAASGHDENVTPDTVRRALGTALADHLSRLSLGLYAMGSEIASARGLIIADTKFEFGIDPAGQLVLIDEVLTPDSSRFWPQDDYIEGRPQLSFDKQPVRDWLARERAAGRWNGEHPAPDLPETVIAATTARYLDAFDRLTGHALPGVT